MRHLNVDIHGITRDHIEEYLDILLMFAPQDVEDICVIHGYHNGHVLRDCVRLVYKNERIEEVQIYESGSTLLRLVH